MSQNQSIQKLMKRMKINSSNVEAAIADFESEVDFELVPVIAASSTSVLHVSWVLTVLLFLIFLSVLEFIYYFDMSIFNQVSHQTIILIIFGLVAISMVLGQILAKVDFIQRKLILKNQRDADVRSKTASVFYQKRLFQTKSNQGLLLYISFMEKRIQVEPDPRCQIAGIDQMSQRVLNIIQTHFSKKHYETGLIEAIAYLKSALIDHFPQKKDQKNQNQIPNKLIWWND